MKKIIVCCLGVLVATLDRQCAFADENDVLISEDKRKFVQPSAELTAKSLVYVNNHRASIDSIISGVVRIRETLKEGSKTTESDILCAFDTSHDRIRYDHRIVGQPVGASFFARNSDECLYYQSSQSFVGRFPRDWKRYAYHGRPLDLRCVGVYPLNGVGVRFPVDKYRDRMEKGVYRYVQSVTEEAERLISIKWNVPRDDGSRFLSEVVFDRDQGTMPIKHHDIYFKTEDGQVTRSDWSDTTWQQRSEVWVPLTWRLEDKTDGEVYDYQFNWESVNEPVPDKLFQLEGFDLPNGTAIWNHRLGEPIHEGVIGQPTRTTPSTANSPLKAKPEPQASDILFWFNIGIGVLAGTVVALVIFLRRRTK